MINYPHNKASLNPVPGKYILLEMDDDRDQQDTAEKVQLFIKILLLVVSDNEIVYMIAYNRHIL